MVNRLRQAGVANECRSRHERHSPKSRVTHFEADRLVREQSNSDARVDAELLHDACVRRVRETHAAVVQRDLQAEETKLT